MYVFTNVAEADRIEISSDVIIINYVIPICCGCHARFLNEYAEYNKSFLRSAMSACLSYTIGAIYPHMVRMKPWKVIGKC